MRRVPGGWVVGSLFSWMMIATGGALVAAGPPSDNMLKKHGLKRVGSVLTLETEAGVHEKAQEIRDLARDWRRAVAIQNSTVSESQYQATVRQLNNELNVLKSQSNAATQNINRLPKMRSRRGTYYANNYVTEEFQELSYYRNQLQMEINQRNTFLNQLRSQSFDPKARVKADAEAQTKEEALQQGLVDLRKVVDEVTSKYEEVKKDPQVGKWLQIPEGAAHVKPKLGPSRTFRLDVKVLEQYERKTASGETATPSHKSTRKGHRPRYQRTDNIDPEDSPF